MGESRNRSKKSAGDEHMHTRLNLLNEKCGGLGSSFSG